MNKFNFFDKEPQRDPIPVDPANDILEDIFVDEGDEPLASGLVSNINLLPSSGEFGDDDEYVDMDDEFDTFMQGPYF